MWFQFISYLNYRMKAKGLHGTHSPLIYDFVERVLQNEHAFYAYRKLERLRNRQLQDKGFIEVQDFGAGSKKLDSKRAIASIAKVSGTTEKYNRLLHRIAWFYQAKNILEFGTSLGLGTAALALADSAAKVVSVEGDPATAKRAKENLKGIGLNQVKVMNLRFDEALIELKDETWDLIFLDGHHEEAATIRYAQALVPKLNTGGVIVLDDIYWSKGMASAWNQLKEHPQLTYSIDLYRMGILSFQEGMEKGQHFVLKY